MKGSFPEKEDGMDQADSMDGIEGEGESMKFILSILSTLNSQLSTFHSELSPFKIL